MAEQADLPAGITRELRPVSDRLDVHYRFTCRKDGVLCGERLCDRAAKMPQALQEHQDCQPGWAHLQRTDTETPEDHVHRLKATFSYKKTEADREANAKLKAGSTRRTSSGPAPHRQVARPESGSVSASVPAAQQRAAKPKTRSPTKPVASPPQALSKAKPAAPARAAASSKPVPQPSEQKQPLQPRNSNSASSPIRRYFKVVQPSTQPQKAGAGPISAPAKLSAAPKHDSTPKAQPAKASALPLSPRQARLAADQEAGKELSKQEAGQTRVMLEEAHTAFRGQLSERAQFHRVDIAACIQPEALIGRQIRVHWADDDAWYAGKVTGYLSETGQHKVDYSDGDQETVWLPLEQVRLSLHSGEELLAPTGASLRDWGACLAASADGMQTGRLTGVTDAGVAQGLLTAAEKLQAHAADLKAPTGDAASGSTSRPGAPIWAKEGTWPWWPALVITPQTAEEHPAMKKLGLVGNGVCLRYFGTMEWGCVGAKKVQSFSAGLGAGFASKGPGRAGREKQDFYLGLIQMASYLKTGKLPEGMQMDNNDDPFSDEDLDEPVIPVSSVKLPFTVGTLKVASLGSINFYHPGFHTEQALFPVGFSATRTIASPASSKAPAPHLCEILAQPCGRGPLFRVSVKGKVWEASNPSQAWAGVFEGPDKPRGFSGLRLFGLSLPQVSQLLQQLPNAAHCSRYRCWKGVAPVPIPLTDEDRRQIGLASIQAHQLPEGVHEVPAPLCNGICQVCWEHDDTAEDQMLQCDACRISVHMACYGVKSRPDGRLWLCDVCALGTDQWPACALCPVRGGVMKQTACGNWAHLACALWTPETITTDEQLIDGLGNVSKARLALECGLCKQRHGACIQCACPACFAAFHPLCARSAGLAMLPLERPDDHGAAASSSSSSNGGSADERAGPCGKQDSAQLPVGGQRAAAVHEKAGTNLATALGALHARQPQAAQVACDGHQQQQQQRRDVQKPSDAVDLGAAAEQDAAAAMREPMDIDQSAHATETARVKAREPARQAAAEQPAPSATPEATDCARATAAESGAAAIPGPFTQQAGTADAACIATIGSLPPQKAADQTQTGMPKPRRRRVNNSELQGTSLGNGVRLVCFCRRHTPSARYHPELIPTLRTTPAAAALAHAPPAPMLQQAAGREADGGSLEQLCSRTAPFNHALRRGFRAPEAVAAALAKRAYVRSTPYLVGPGLQSAAFLHRRQLTRRPNSRVHVWGDCAPRFSSELGLGRQSSTALDADAQAACPSEPRVAEGVLSVQQRYTQMILSWHLRLTAGKSAIHGWGAFAKLPHAAGDMMVEYQGEVVRASVADCRERRLYDTLVGAGTYIFSLNADTQTQVDATRRGNMAHLLNHSCAPNCVSRNHTILDPRTGLARDHVIIYALRDIAPAEELTYDYRFNSSEQLPCNCGASSCRGWVNFPAEEEVIFAPVSKLKRLKLSLIEPLSP